MRLLSLIFIIGTAILSVSGQSQAIIPGTQTGETVVEVADQPGCPVALSLKPMKGEIPRVAIYITVLTDKAIVGYSVVEQGEGTGSLLGNASPSTPLIRDSYPSVVNTVGGREGKVILRVDFVQFSDGTSWGKDEYQQSKSINTFIEGWKLLDQRLREVAKTYPDPDYFTNMSAQVRPGWAIPIKNGKASPLMPGDYFRNMAYDGVLRTLRQLGRRDAEAQEIARKLELMRTPAPEEK